MSGSVAFGAYLEGYAQALADAQDALYREKARYSRRVNQNAGIQRGINAIEPLKLMVGAR